MGICVESDVSSPDVACQAGLDAIAVLTPLKHPRLPQAEQHLAHVYVRLGQHAQAMEMYKQSIVHFELLGTAKFDTEYACTLSSLSQNEDTARASLAYARAALASCEAITGQDHVEARQYRQNLVHLLRGIDGEGNELEALRVMNGGVVEVSADDVAAMQTTAYT